MDVRGWLGPCGIGNQTLRQPLSSCSCVNVSNYQRRTTLVGVTPCASYCRLSSQDDLHLPCRAYILALQVAAFPVELQ